jgi:hypothetical protein
MKEKCMVAVVTKSYVIEDESTGEKISLELLPNDNVKLAGIEMKLETFEVLLKAGQDLIL